MRKEKKPAAPAGIPNWFVTYSDVVTLLMTFFILLMTFATDEPEKFERMQTAVFGGGGGGSGAIGHNPSPIEMDSLIVRFRPHSARYTRRGSEMPPLHEEPAEQSVGMGLKSLEELSDLVQSQRCQITLRREHLISNGDITDHGRATLRLISAQLKRFNGHAQLIAPTREDTIALIPVCLRIASETNTYPGSFAVSTRATDDPVQSRFITIVVTRDIF